MMRFGEDVLSYAQKEKFFAGRDEELLCEYTSERDDLPTIWLSKDIDDSVMYVNVFETIPTESGFNNYDTSDMREVFEEIMSDYLENGSMLIEDYLSVGFRLISVKMLSEHRGFVRMQLLL